MPATYNPWGEANAMGVTWAGGPPRKTAPRRPANTTGGMFKPASPLRQISRGLPEPAMPVIGGNIPAPAATPTTMPSWSGFGDGKPRKKIMGGISPDRQTLPDSQPDPSTLPTWAGGQQASNGSSYDPVTGEWMDDQTGMPLEGRANGLSGGPVRGGQTVRVNEDGLPELAVPLDGTQPVVLDGPQEQLFTPAKDVAVLNFQDMMNLPQLKKDGVTPLGNGDKALRNKYGRGFATGLPQADMVPTFAGRDGAMRPGAKGKLEAVPDVVPEGNPYRTASGVMPFDSQSLRENIDLFLSDRAGEINAVDAVDPEQWRAEMDLRNPVLKAGMPTWAGQGKDWTKRPRPAFMEAAMKPVGSASEGGYGPGGMFTGQQMERAKRRVQREGSSARGLDELGNWLLKEGSVNNDVSVLDVPGTDYVVPMVGKRPMGTLPKQSANTAPAGPSIDELLAMDGVESVTRQADGGVSFRVVPPAQRQGSASQTKAGEKDTIYFKDPEGKLQTKAWPKGHALPEGWQRSEPVRNIPIFRQDPKTKAVETKVWPSDKPVPQGWKARDGENTEATAKKAVPGWKAWMNEKKG